MGEIAVTWELERYKRYKFPVVVHSDFRDIALVHPLMQNKVNSVYEAFLNDKRIKSIVVFGSSITLRCNCESDLDFCVELVTPNTEDKNDISEKMQIMCDWRADILWRDNISSSDGIMQDIERGLILI